MKPSKTALLFAAALAVGGASMAAACSSDEPVETVYGPPEMFETDDPIEDVYGPPEYFDDNGDVDDVMDVDGPVVALYGPPEMLGSTAEQND